MTTQAGDFGDLLASLKATHSNLQSLTGGLADASEGNHVENMVKKIFDAIDMDGRCAFVRSKLMLRRSQLHSVEK